MDNLKDFINQFTTYLLESENDCMNNERGEIEACIYQEVFQVFGRMVENTFGVKVFEKENNNE